MLRYTQRDYEILELLRQHKDTWLTFKEIKGSSPVNDRHRLNLLIENGDVVRRPQPFTAIKPRGKRPYEYRLRRDE